MNGSRDISRWSKTRLREQGLGEYSDAQLCEYRFGNRFAYFVCLAIVVTGFVLKSQAWLIAANLVAILGMSPPYHPVDYVYNAVVRRLIDRPRYPGRTNQGRFACGIATTLLLVINYALWTEHLVLMYIAGAVLLSSALLVTFTDLCIPSLIYNALFERKSK